MENRQLKQQRQHFWKYKICEERLKDTLSKRKDRGEITYIYMCIYLYMYSHTPILVMYRYTLCFLIHACTHARTQREKCQTLLKFTKRKDRMQSTQFTAQKKKVDLSIIKWFGYDRSSDVPTVTPRQSRWGNSLLLEASQERISVPVVPF